MNKVLPLLLAILIYSHSNFAQERIINIPKVYEVDYYGARMKYDVEDVHVYFDQALGKYLMTIDRSEYQPLSIFELELDTIDKENNYRYKVLDKVENYTFRICEVKTTRPFEELVDGTRRGEVVSVQFKSYDGELVGMENWVF